MELNGHQSTRKKSCPEAAEKTSSAAAGPTLTDLPPRNTIRWVRRHKAAVVAAVQSGVISLQDARKRYDLSVEELLSWEHAVAKFGIDGLRASQAQLGRRSQR